MFKDNELPLRERGLLATILSLPDTWDFSINGLVSILPDGKKSIYSSIKILTDLGYCRKTQTRKECGSFGDIVYDFYEKRLLKKTEPLTPSRLTPSRLTTKDPQVSTNNNKVLNKEDSANENELVKDDKETQFEKFYNLYDYKKGKMQAEKAFSRLTKNNIEEVFKALPKYIASTPDVKFRKYPATWLNTRGWEDEYEEKTTGSKRILSKEDEEFIQKYHNFRQ